MKLIKRSFRNMYIKLIFLLSDSNQGLSFFNICLVFSCCKAVMRWERRECFDGNKVAIFIDTALHTRARIAL